MTIELGTIIAMLVGFASILKYFQAREDRIWKEIGKIRGDIDNFRINYLDRFNEMGMQLGNTEVRITEKIADTEKNVRESHHNATEAISKVLQSLEVKLAIISEKIHPTM